MYFVYDTSIARTYVRTTGFVYICMHVVVLVGRGMRVGARWVHRARQQ